MATAEQSRQPVLELTGVGKEFGAIRALHDVDMQVFPGEVVGLMGDNGAGKSTLVRIIAGNFQPSAGEIILAGEPVRFANSDPRMILFFCIWLRHFFDIDESRLRLRLYLHQGLDLDAANTYWNQQIVEFGEEQQNWLLELFNIIFVDFARQPIQDFRIGFGFFQVFSAEVINGFLQVHIALEFFNDKLGKERFQS
jgi:ABC-type oligopeptide transport system ATPase subunit